MLKHNWIVLPAEKPIGDSKGNDKNDEDGVRVEDHRDDVSVGRDEVAEEEEGEECDAAEGEGEHHRGRDRGTGKEEGENATNEVADGETEKTTSWDKEDLLPSSSIVDGSTY